MTIKRHNKIVKELQEDYQAKIKELAKDLRIARNIKGYWLHQSNLADK